jgi:ubiquinone/menaquinone biosynthesis C-methylase UbiE
MKADDYYKNTIARTSDWQPSAKGDASTESSFPHIMQEIARLGAANGAILDVGCQAGTLLREMNGRFIERYGVDIGDYTDYWKKIEGCKFQVVNIDQEPLPFPDAYFDLVTCIMVLEHIFDVFNAVKEISRVTRPGGYAIVEVPNISYFKHFFLF